MHVQIAITVSFIRNASYQAKFVRPLSLLSELTDASITYQGAQWHLRIRMKEFQREFIEFCLECNVLKFGHFTLKSGRQSPFFFNAGLFQTGNALRRLGEFYAQAFMESAKNLEFQTLFGPAYKGIPLVSSLAVALSSVYGLDLPYCFNRKEAKDHGEGGVLVGAPLKGNVLIVDDVMTAGTAIRECVQLLDSYRHACKLAMVLIALDRQERVSDSIQASATQQVTKEYGVPVVSIIKLEHLIEYLQEKSEYADHLTELKAYRERYGV